MLQCHENSDCAGDNVEDVRDVSCLCDRQLEDYLEVGAKVYFVRASSY